MIVIVRKRRQTQPRVNIYEDNDYVIADLVALAHPFAFANPHYTTALQRGSLAYRWKAKQPKLNWLFFIYVGVNPTLAVWLMQCYIMPELNWFRVLERVGKHKLQQVSYEPEKNLVSFGSVLIRCEACQRWVRESDYRKFCNQGMCEFSAEVNLDEVKRSVI